MVIPWVNFNVLLLTRIKKLLYLWEILSPDHNEIARISKKINFSGFLYDCIFILHHATFGIFQFLIIALVSPIFPRLPDVNYTITANSQIIANLKRVVTSKNTIMEVEISNENQKEIDERLILAAALRAFPGGATFYPNNFLT